MRGRRGVTRDQFAEVIGSSQSAAAAGAGSEGGGTAPSGLPASGDTGTSSTTPPTDSSGAAGTADTHTGAATGSEPGPAEAESGQPTVAPSDNTPATTEPTEAEHEEELATSQRQRTGGRAPLNRDRIVGSTAPRAKRSKYSMYGISLSKNTGFAAGARPVIYIPDAESGWVPPDEQWRLMRFDRYVDFTHEREWRVRGDLRLDVGGIYVLVWNLEEARQIMAMDTKLPICGVLPMEDLSQIL